jgi:hypothetical protein
MGKSAYLVAFRKLATWRAETKALTIFEQRLFVQQEDG